jgi:hypothetical protein
MKVKEQLVVRKNMDVNEQSLMFIYTHILSYYKLFLYFNLCLSVMLDMRDYPTLHLDINESKGTACSKKGYGCK